MRIAALVFLSAVALAGAARAADPVIIEAPEIDPARFGWSGFYVGGSVGYAWLKDADYQFNPPLLDEGEDWIFGGHAGYLQEFGNGAVIGAEFEATRLDIDYEMFSFITVENAFAIKGRAGYAFDRVLLTGHAGGVYATTNFLGLKDWGYALGAGVDFALTENVSVGGQYSHMRFNNFDGTQIDATIDTATARASLRF